MEINIKTKTMMTNKETLEIYKKRKKAYENEAMSCSDEIIRTERWLNTLNIEREMAMKNFKEREKTIKERQTKYIGEYNKNIHNVYEIETKIKNLTNDND